MGGRISGTWSSRVGVWSSGNGGPRARVTTVGVTSRATDDAPVGAEDLARIERSVFCWMARICLSEEKLCPRAKLAAALCFRVQLRAVAAVLRRRLTSAPTAGTSALPVARATPAPPSFGHPGVGSAPPPLTRSRRRLKLTAGHLPPLSSAIFDPGRYTSPARTPAAVHRRRRPPPPSATASV
ncbi:hypothetical protein GUJ93_ZPchr0013g35228 [Zizania palustris]|uniref:Uncharacterized protein n=1 Tax=Zizania palustris TaxID=103762 RepID=A0A8J5X2F7_ZIZPA|nr:hypothetical protein GUJ93_ZPchr0013g35228 [Zizania palustris]